MANESSVQTDWHALSLNEREREYSPSSCIGGNYMPFIEAYQTRSQAAKVKCSNLGATWTRFPYGPQAPQCVELCVPLPRSPFDSKKPGLLLFFHGGYWQELSAQESLFPADACIERGLAYAAVDYTLAPDASLASIVAECRQAVTWLFQHAEALGFDANNIVVAGSSAGAHLAAMVAWPGWGPGDTRQRFAIRAAVLVSGIYDLEPLIGTTINTALALDVRGAREQSPQRLPLAGFPRTLVCWGAIETEEFKRQSRDFTNALIEAGTPWEVIEVAGRNHFDVILDLADAGTTLGRKTLALLQSG